MIYILKSVEKLIFNGIDIEYEIIGENNTYDSYFIINSVYGRGIEGVENNLISVPGRDGAYSAYTYRPPRYLNVSVTIKGTSFHDLRKKLERLSSILNTDGKNVPITFGDELDRIYYGKLDQVSGGYEKSHIYQAVITFICPDPFKYGKEETVTGTDNLTIHNQGTAETEPIFELTATKKSTFAMVSDGTNYNVIGTIADVDEVIVDDKEVVFEERGQTLDLWSSAGTSIDGGVVAGSLSTDNDGITVPSYGADTSRWHGPALMRELSIPLQDFEVEMMLQGRTTTLNQTFRIEFYLFDENMKSLGKMAIKDDTLGAYRKKAEARYGPHVTNYKNYLIDKNNYQYNWDFFFGMLRMRRKGNNFEFYVTRINNNTKHVYSLKETFSDVDNEFMGRLKYIQIHIGKYGSTERAYGPKINYIKTSKLNTLTVDQTPYILDVGDVVTFDHKDEEILINGEPRNDLKNFGGSFFNLLRGQNTIIVSPEDSFDATAKYREKYL